jgi:predicted transposase YbfD/YdcC
MSQKAEHRDKFTENRPDSAWGMASPDRSVSQSELQQTSFVDHTLENSCHWTLDVTYCEDESRIREPQLRENFAWLNRMSLSLLKQHHGRQSIAMKRRPCGWSHETTTLRLERRLLAGRYYRIIMLVDAGP